MILLSGIQGVAFQELAFEIRNSRVPEFFVREPDAMFVLVDSRDRTVPSPQQIEADAPGAAADIHNRVAAPHVLKENRLKSERTRNGLPVELIPIAVMFGRHISYRIP